MAGYVFSIDICCKGLVFNFGVEVASSTSSPIKLGSLASPRARRLRFYQKFGLSLPLLLYCLLLHLVQLKELVFLLSALVAVASSALFAGVVASNFGVAAVDVPGAVEVADVAEAAVLVLLGFTS